VIRHQRKQRRGVFYEIRLDVSNTRLDLLQWIRGRFGGSIIQTGRPRKGRRQMYKWCVYGRPIRALIALVLPYLVIKTEQAKVAIAYLSLGHRTQVPTARADLWEQMRALNLKGPDNTTVSGSTSVTRESGQECLL
jgi:hypothetical protein